MPRSMPVPAPCGVEVGSTPRATTAPSQGDSGEAASSSHTRACGRPDQVIEAWTWGPRTRHPARTGADPSSSGPTSAPTRAGVLASTVRQRASGSPGQATGEPAGRPS